MKTQFTFNFYTKNHKGYLVVFENGVQNFIIQCKCKKDVSIYTNKSTTRWYFNVNNTLKSHCNFYNQLKEFGAISGNIVYEYRCRYALTHEENIRDFEIDHIDGDVNNFDIQNLIKLTPKVHSQKHGISSADIKKRKMAKLENMLIYLDDKPSNPRRYKKVVVNSYYIVKKIKLDYERGMGINALAKKFGFHKYKIKNILSGNYAVKKTK